MALYLPKPKEWYVLAASGVAVSRTTVNGAGDATEATLVTVSVPGGAMGANGRLRIISLWSVTNSVNVKTARVRFGGLAGTIFSSGALTSTASWRAITDVSNRNSSSSQVGGPNNTPSTFGVSTTAVATAALDTASAQDIVFTTAWAGATSGETLTLESYVVEVLYQA